MIRPALLIVLLAGCSSPKADPPKGGASVLFFITSDCPIANSFAPEIKRIVADYRPRGVTFSMVYTDLQQTLEAAVRHASDYGYDSRVRLDAGRVLSRQYGVSVTPEAVLLDSAGERRYRGRIDDRYLAPGQYRLKPTTRELRDAIEAVLEGRPVAVAETKAAGCPLTD
jgi:hypothetical protein